MKVVWTRKASRHLRAAYDYWAGESSPAAADTHARTHLLAPSNCWSAFPKPGGRAVFPATRELVIVPTPFLVAYRVRRTKIEILALLHGARKWPELFDHPLIANYFGPIVEPIPALLVA